MRTNNVLGNATNSSVTAADLNGHASGKHAPTATAEDALGGKDAPDAQENAAALKEADATGKVAAKTKHAKGKRWRALVQPASDLEHMRLREALSLSVTNSAFPSTCESASWSEVS